MPYRNCPNCHVLVEQIAHLEASLQRQLNINSELLDKLYRRYVDQRDKPEHTSEGK